jgi:hypothetical protein
MQTGSMLGHQCKSERVGHVSFGALPPVTVSVQPKVHQLNAAMPCHATLLC